MTDRFQLGICEWCLPPLGPHVCDMARKYGLDGVALDFGSVSEGLRLADPEIRQWYREESRKTGVSFCALALNVLFSFDILHWGSREEEQQLAWIFREAVQAAAELGIPVIQVPNFPKNAMTEPAHLTVMAERLRTLCDMAAPSGIVIGTENTLDAAGNRELLRLTDRDNLQVYFDTENPYFFHFGEAPGILSALAPLVCQAHAKDGAEGSMSLTPLGQGNARFLECAEILKQSGWRGWVILENEYKAFGRDNDRLLAADVRTMREAFLAPALAQQKELS